MTLDPNSLSEIALFKGLPTDRLKRLAEILRQKVVPSGTNMITAEQPGEVVYVVLEGTATNHSRADSPPSPLDSTYCTSRRLG